MNEWQMGALIVGAVCTLLCIAAALWISRINAIKDFLENLKSKITYAGKDDNGNDELKYLMDPELVFQKVISLRKTVSLGLCVLAAIFIVCITSIIKPNKLTTKVEANKDLPCPNSAVQVNITCPSCKINTMPRQIAEPTKPKVPDAPKGTAPQPLPADSNTSAVSSKTSKLDTTRKVTENTNSSK